MLRRTTPVVSFTTSHRALALRPSRTLLGGDMHSKDRYKAAWDDIPMHMLGWSRKRTFEWYWRATYQLGLRDTNRMTKLRSVINWAAAFSFLYVTYVSFFYSSIYHIYFEDWPEHFKRENARDYAVEHGGDVWAGDGKFIRPYFHINPPMLTMTEEDI
ncbi:cytochrome c oxidase VIII (COX VIII) [Strigomonas culicis]|nr:cytochrome c oxidase VIII (COX VIII) [Strigomonas culicis]EPY37230.1 cytochrome c oxidase VIII (COX VIII) [Strigomonas culicis]|eukprot:EPY37123.1 cytochrome c oxidase VIII (COX VIII) [Strigomonas culicis]